MSVTVPILEANLPMLDIMHAILITYTYRTALRDNHAHIGWGQGLLATIVMASGGGSTVAMLRGEPLGILKNNHFFGLYGITYWLMFSNPYIYQCFQFLFSVPLVEQLFTTADGIRRNHSIVTTGVEGVALNPVLGNDKWMAKVVCGAIAGCGGGLWVDAFRLTSQNWTFSTPRLLHTASIDMKASVITSVFYVVASNPELCEWIGLPVLETSVAQAWSAVILCSSMIYRTYATRSKQDPAPVEDKKKDQ
ncbi:hypothetical protein DFQ28_006652 [Apophysomyces sp. BC1034]|nr:hypothetical protein DFQ30_004678 [Apophysomyces sp. BC1015]KAG0182549.1 hypothetical protein DFQ29_003551 [Apophysomyces sp. BC1021]KAG0193058.1 hypothetical protein DFQ28_006652 [Apophysomyces sp. BC1034]